jgi:Fic family protein
MEARAHIAVQQWIDGGGLANHRALTAEGICEIHRRFCALLPEDLLWLEDPQTHERVRVIGGELRRRDVQVGRHVAISPGALPRFLQRFEEVYGKVGRTESIISAAAAHHRLLWMHPFLDGNGRVARLMSHAVLLEVLDTGAVWSVARGLARNVQDFKRHLADCDSHRRNDLDGRGTLSEEALAAFTTFFLTVCIDQVTFMQGLVQPERLRARILMWAEEESRVGALPPKAGNILEAVLYRGELPRGDVDAVVGTGERQARRIVAALVDRGVLISESSRAPLRLVFPAALAGRWMPALFPEQ